MKTDRLDEAEPEIRKLLPIQERLVADEPGDGEALLAHMQASLGDLLQRRAKVAEEGLRPRLEGEAEDLFRRSIRLYAALADDFPDTEEFRRRLAIVYDNLSITLWRTGRREEAIDAERRGIAEEETLVSRGGDSRLMVGGGYGYYQLGAHLHEVEKVEEAADAFRQARDRFEKKVENNPRVASFVHEFADFLTNCPATQFRDLPRAIALEKQALQLAPHWRESWYVLGLAEYQAGHWDAATEALGKWSELGPTDRPGVEFFLAMAHWRAGRKGEARKWYDQAVSLMDRQKWRDEGLRRRRAEAAALLGLPEPTAPARKEVPRPSKR